MRLRPGRPDLAAYADRFDLPRADDATPVRVTFLGVSTLLVDDGQSAVLTDGFFSRPGLLRVATRPLAPSASRIDAALRRAGIGRLDALIPVHTHFDHALDAAAVAERTGAVLVGGRSTRNLGLGHGLPADRLLEVSSGQTVDLAAIPATEPHAGAFTATFVASRHCPPDRYPGEISAPLRPPARAAAYRCGEAWSILLAHRPTGRSVLVQGSAGFVPGALAGRHADVVYLGVGQLGLRPAAEIEAYWTETVRAVGARRAVLVHWDDFFRPLDRPLRALPFAGDDLDVTMRVLTPLAEADGVGLSLPTVWEPADPWAAVR
jgi:L-ascorbate metabolism protein UlaG (beta-lactamase superfamily)